LLKVLKGLVELIPLEVNPAQTIEQLPFTVTLTRLPGQGERLLVFFQSLLSLTLQP
jgi:hypothetical protein